MRPALIDLANVISGHPENRPILAFGLDEDVPGGQHFVHVSTLVARQFLTQTRTGNPLTEAAIATVAGIPVEAVEETVCVVFSRRRFGWTTLDAADLAALLAPLVGAVLMTVAAGGLIQSAAELGALLRERRIEPLFLGHFPPADGLTHGGPVAVLSRVRRARGDQLPRVVAFVHSRNQDTLLPHTLTALLQDGIIPIVIDHGSAEGAAARAVSWMDHGAKAVEQTGNDSAMNTATVTRLAADSAADWCIIQDATERVSGPWQTLGLRASLAKFEELGYNAAGVTAIDFDEVPGYDVSEDFADVMQRWRFSIDPNDFHRTVAWQSGAQAARLITGNGTAIDPVGWRRAPYNLLFRRYDLRQSVAVSSRDASGSGDEALMPDANPDQHRFATMFWNAGGFESRFLVERLTGFGIFHHVFPQPADCRWWSDESIMSWSGSVLKAGVGRLPAPDPMNYQPGMCLIRWDTNDGQPASLWVQRPDQPEQFAGRGPSGTISFDGIVPNRPYQARLYTDDRRQTTLGAVRFGFRMTTIG